MAEEDSNINGGNQVNGGASSQQQNVVLVPTANYSTQFPDITKYEKFDSQNFRRWQECVHSILDMYSVAAALGLGFQIFGLFFLKKV
jgi:hypothetical protein